MTPPSAQSAPPATPQDAAEHAEARRQATLIAALWSPIAEGAAALQPWCAAGPVPVARGLQAYRATAGASAERLLAAGFPVLQALIGPDNFAAMARAWWRACPPTRGDLAWAGATLPAFIASDAQLADTPYLADLAALEWRLLRAGAAADAALDPAAGQASLHLLADADPADLTLLLAPGTALLASRWPVVQLWQAHPDTADGSPRGLAAEAAPALNAALQAALANRHAETALVWRGNGWHAQAEVIDAGSACFMQALLDGDGLLPALDRTRALHPAWGFEAWLLRALRTGWLLGAARR